jgi:flagellar hook-length control protein FliK
MQVKVSVNQEQVTVSFTSQHSVVRDVLDQNLNRLRDMFSEQGLNLANVDVSDKSFSRQQGDANDQNGRGRTHDLAQDEETPIAISAIVQQRLVDHYA